MNVNTRTLAEISADAFRILSRELGVADTIRFINQFHPGSGNYTEERQTHFKSMTVAQIVAQAQEFAEKSGVENAEPESPTTEP